MPKAKTRPAEPETIPTTIDTAIEQDNLDSGEEIPALATSLPLALPIEFTCTQDDLNDHLALASKAVPNRSSHPVLANILLVADVDRQTITLTGFDLSIAIQTTFSATVERGGLVTLPCKLLSDMVSRLPAGELTLAIDTNCLTTLTCKTGRYQIRGMGAEEYPDIPTATGQPFTLPKAIVAAGIQHTLFSVSNDQTKQVLTGVHCTLDDEKMEWASTDGHRLSLWTYGWDEQDTVPDQRLKVTVPGEALLHLKALLKLEANETVEICQEGWTILFRCGDTTLYSRLLEGEYPNYPQFIPRQFARDLTIDRRNLLSSLERIAILADQKQNIVKLSLDPEQQEVVISVDAQDVGNGRETISVELSGAALDIAFNVKYLLDCLKVIESHEIVFRCNSATSPAVVQPLGGDQFTGLLMPVQIRV